MAMCLSRRPTVNWTPRSDVSSVGGDVDLDVTSLDDVTCLLVTAALMKSFGFDSIPVAKFVAKYQHSFITWIKSHHKTNTNLNKHCFESYLYDFQYFCKFQSQLYRFCHHSNVSFFTNYFLKVKIVSKSHKVSARFFVITSSKYWANFKILSLALGVSQICRYK